jgi:hypothetical protein
VSADIPTFSVCKTRFGERDSGRLNADAMAGSCPQPLGAGPDTVRKTKIKGVRLRERNGRTALAA